MVIIHGTPKYAYKLIAMKKNITLDCSRCFCGSTSCFKKRLCNQPHVIFVQGPSVFQHLTLKTRRSLGTMLSVPLSSPTLLTQPLSLWHQYESIPDCIHHRGYNIHTQTNHTHISTHSHSETQHISLLMVWYCEYGLVTLHILCQDLWIVECWYTLDTHCMQQNVHTNMGQTCTERETVEYSEQAFGIKPLL